MLIMLRLSGTGVLALRIVLHASIPSWLAMLVYSEVTSTVQSVVPGIKSEAFAILLMKSVVSLTYEDVLEE